MNVKKKLRELEGQAAVREAKRYKEFLQNMSDAEFLFVMTHFCHPEEVEPPEEPRTRQCTHNGMRMTITLERAQ